MHYRWVLHRWVGVRVRRIRVRVRVDVDGNITTEICGVHRWVRVRVRRIRVRRLGLMLMGILLLKYVECTGGLG